MLIETSISIILIPTFLHYFVNYGVKYASYIGNKYFPNVKENKYLNDIAYAIQIRITRMQLLMRMFLGIFWLHAWIIIQLIKVMDFGIRLVFTLPDGLFSIPFLLRRFLTTNGEELTVLNAFTESGCVTNKFKLFLSLYWDTASLDKNFARNGFSKEKLQAIFGNVLLMISYITGDNKNVDDLTKLVKRIYIDLSQADKHIDLDEESDIIRNDINPYDDEMLFQQTADLVKTFTADTKYTKSNNFFHTNDMSDDEKVPQLLADT